MLFRVGICTLNRPDGITRQIYSLLEQTHEDWEAIIVCQSEVAPRLPKTQQRITVIHTPWARGSSAARNLAYSASKAIDEYSIRIPVFWAWWDDDDIVPANYMEEFVKKFQALHDRPTCMSPQWGVCLLQETDGSFPPVGESDDLGPCFPTPCCVMRYHLPAQYPHWDNLGRRQDRRYFANFPRPDFTLKNVIVQAGRDPLGGVRDKSGSY